MTDTPVKPRVLLPDDEDWLSLFMGMEEPLLMQLALNARAVQEGDEEVWDLPPGLDGVGAHEAWGRLFQALPEPLRHTGRNIGRSEPDRNRPAGCYTLYAPDGRWEHTPLYPADVDPRDVATVAAVLDHSRGILATLPPAPDESAVRTDLECRGCDSAACLAANQLARAALDRAVALAAVSTVALAAARTILDRAHLALTPGDRWNGARMTAADHLSRVYFTAAAALAVPADEVHGHYRGARRRRGGLAVNLRKGCTRYWLVRWGRAVWH
ncbi:hypothetical protein [Streptomyces sp. VN1]|uniref:hypothetical protein n=1 Tax=Streptomyces sp. VN1 TaxID=1821625 RepID=UPI0014139963|nr:hypothetical protein [Streptomyces sp. VN1]QIP74654.1 hypothetical protein EZV63_36430 [Streptomyces sp. VN1]